MSSTLGLSGLMGRLSLSGRAFSTTSRAFARQAPNAGPPRPVRKNKGPVRSDNYKRIATLKKNMFSPAPPPLRMARLRYMRHWTIHRAWQLFRRNQHLKTEQERMRMHSSMYLACEELRQTVGPAAKGEGYLYRVAMEKKGVWGTDSIPIEYARFQTDSPAKQAWNHEWKR